MKIAFKIISYLEGLSYLGLLFVGVPMKRFADDPSIVKALGMPHGILFITYVIFAFYVRDSFKWDRPTFVKVLLASIIPFGTFYIDRKYC
jgi:integral membrane protein